MASGNYIYLLLDVGLIQMLKSFTPVIVMLGLYFSRIEIPSQSVVFSILMISVGTAVTCSFSPHVTILGLLVMLLTTSFEAVRMVLTQYILKDLKLGVVESQYFLSSSTAMCLFTASALTEIPQMIQARGFYILYEQFGVFVLAASLGILVNYLTYFVIQLTSSLNLKILGMFRNILLIMVSIFLYQEKVTTNAMIGYGVALVGFIW